MAATRSVRKSPLRAALDSFADSKNRQDALKIVHAVLSTAMVESALEKGDEKSAAKKGYKSECFAEMIKLVEDEMGDVTSPFIPKKQTIFTTPSAMPANGIVRAVESKRSEQQTSST